MKSITPRILTRVRVVQAGQIARRMNLMLLLAGIGLLHQATFAASRLVELPLQFEPNVGQVGDGVAFLSRSPGYTLLLKPDQAVFSSRSAVQSQESRAETQLNSRADRNSRKQRHNGQSIWTSWSMNLVGADAHASVESVGQLPGRVNYLRGRDPRNWHTGLGTFQKVICRQLYPGVDLVYYGNHRRVECDFILSPGADPDQIMLDFQGVQELQVDAGGDLLITAGQETVRWTKPYVYQASGDSRQEIPGRFVLMAADKVKFEVANYDRSKPLVIDPVMVYSTYLGGSDYDQASGIAVDGSGSAYVVGETYSTDFPGVNAIQMNMLGSEDAFVAKLNPAGTALLYSTYIGGDGADYAYGVAVDAGGNAYVAGGTSSSDFPTSATAYQPAKGGSYDAFLIKLGPQGTNLEYATYLGGPSYDEAYGVAAGVAGFAYLVGETSSGTNFVTTSPLQASGAGHGPNSSADGFVAKFDTVTNSAANSLIYSSWFGGTDDDYPFSITADAAGSVYLTGETYSKDDFPILNALQPTFNNGGLNGFSDAFVTKVNASGSAMEFSTFLGGDGEDTGFAIAQNNTGRIFVGGQTYSVDFPVVNAAQATIGGIGAFYTADGFVSIIQTSGSNLLYSTFLGGSVNDSVNGIAADGAGKVYVAGDTLSGLDFPVSLDADQTTYGGGGSDGFVAVIDPTVSGSNGLSYSSYVGGSDRDEAYAIAVDTAGGFYVAGTTVSTNLLSMPGAYPIHSGNWDAYVLKYSLAAPSVSLQVSRFDSTVVLQWPASATGFVLQSNSDLTVTDGWSDVPDSPVETNGKFSVTRPITAENTYYRLRKP